MSTSPSTSTARSSSFASVRAFADFPREHPAPCWHAATEKLIAESDPEKLIPCLYAAEEALCSRWRQMGNAAIDESERKAMKAAANKLYETKILTLGWPGL
jgi:hypothetical protein